MSLDWRFCIIATAFFVTATVEGTNDYFAKKLNQISAVDQLPETGSFLDSGKAHGRYQRDLSEEAKLQIYEIDVENLTISIRLTTLDLVLDGVDSYLVQIVSDGRVVYYQKRFAVTEDLRCKLWDNALCLQNLSIQNMTGYGDLLESKTMVSGEKNTQKVAGMQWECHVEIPPERQSSRPVDLTITYPSPGFVKFQWKHPRYPYTKIQRFQVRLTVLNTSLIESQTFVNVTVDYPGVPERKEYEMEVELHPSSRYHVEVFPENLHGFGRPARHDFTTPSRIDFDCRVKLHRT